MTNLFIYAVLIVATEAATEIVVAAKLTDDLRAKIRRLAHPATVGVPPPLSWRRRCWIFTDNLLTCGYCTSVWVAGASAMVAPPLLYHDVGCLLALWWSLVNWLVALLLIHRLSNWLHVAFELIKKGRVRTYDLEIKVTGLPLPEATPVRE